MRIAIVGVGRVGTTLGARLHAKGHSIAFGVREPKTSGATADPRPHRDAEDD